LVDPVFSGFASPIKGFAKAFKGTNDINTDQFQEIDLLIITHDHYDHLDYKTIKLLAPKVKKILASMGVRSHLEFWGISPEIIIELNWWQTEQIDKELNITATPTRHFSGRGLIRSKTLWSSFVLDWYGLKLFIGSDSGYDSHFKDIGDLYGPFDFAWLECGQYSRFWPQIHMIPEETVQAALDLKTSHVLPVHWGKFALSIHSWNEPILRFLEAAKDKSFKTIVPIIGSVNNLLEDPQQESWWD
jgi:L-ascorbate metabolism protein UlaG (beta-lactamase superfamily)